MNPRAFGEETTRTGRVTGQIGNGGASDETGNRPWTSRGRDLRPVDSSVPIESTQLSCSASSCMNHTWIGARLEDAIESGAFSLKLDRESDKPRSITRMAPANAQRRRRCAPDCKA